MCTIDYYEGNLLDTTCYVIAHQVNALGGFGSGVAGAIAAKYPEARDTYKADITSGKLKLGGISARETNDGKHIIVHLCGQYNYGGDGKQYTDYEALYKALLGLREWCEERGIEEVAMPYRIGCGLAGGKWQTVLALIEQAFLTSDITISLWKYDR